ncbi:hypothetical protein [uncultured Xanthomonas sp.]|uniref:hypothetical protein n=1 Tax=uncultured Xanthomonas sp. TaxID=152831 RepID=UPI0025DBD868|nr:hypothetical protein [uncultured Xanthomonas sp.]
MARLAESSVVLALRDTQWEMATVLGGTPGLFVSLSGNNDKKLGDIKFANGEKFYLFEAKSTENQIKDEWDRSEKPRKHAYRKVREIIEGLNHPQSPTTSLFNLSLAAHHFLYYAYSDYEHKIQIEPYILGLQRKSGFIEEVDGNEYGIPNRTDQQKKNLVDGLNLVNGVKIYSTLPSENEVKSFTASQLYRESININTGSVPELPIGLALEQFQLYIDFLCDGKDEDIEALIKTKSGALIAFSGKTNNLNKLVSAFEEAEAKADYSNNSRLRGKKKTI